MRFLRGRQIAYLIYEYFRDDVQEFDSKWGASALLRLWPKSLSSSDDLSWSVIALSLITGAENSWNFPAFRAA